MNRSFLLAGLLTCTVARADAPSLVAEESTRLGEVEVRRVRDTSNGVVCYVANSYAYAVQPRGRTVAIHCLKEAP